MNFSGINFNFELMNLSPINLDLILTRNVYISKGKAVVVLLKQCICGLALPLLIMVDFGQPNKF